MKSTRLRSLLLFLSALPFCLSGQTVRILVTDAQKTGLVGANVRLMKVADSTEVFSVTDESGAAAFNGIADGPYVVNMSYVGYEALEKTIRVGPSSRSFSFQLREESVALDAVTVTARKPLVTQDGDKMLVDPSPLASISSNALEVLEAVPGLFVDQDGGVYLTNASPAAIYINDREQKMSSQDMAAILRSLPPGSILRIEVLRTPSTKYDAASSGGIINIVLKKGVKLGRFGSVNLGMNQGVYGGQSAGFSLNDSGNKGNWYLNANYNRNGQEDKSNLFRFLTTEYDLTQRARNLSQSDQGYLGYGLNLDLRPNKLSFSYDGRINGGVNRSDNRNTNLIGAPEEAPLSEVENRLDDRNHSLSLAQDFSLVWKMDTTGSNWDTKAGYSFRTGGNEQDYRTVALFPAIDPVSGEGENEQGNHFFLFQSDLTYNLPKKTRLETGIKSTWQDYDSKADYFRLQNGSLEPDALRTNAFDYRENLNSAYFQASKTVAGSITIKPGVRMEHTFMEGRQTVPGDTSFVINRVDLFPYLFISRPIVKIAGYELSAYLIYRRTISRPGYQNLNPYVRYIDEFSYESGNPALQPQFTQNVEANISFDDRPIFAVGRNYTDGIISSVLYRDENQQGLAVRTFDNIGKSRETYFRLVGALPPGGKYFFVAGVQYNLNTYEGIYFDEPVSFRRGSWRLFTFHSLTITPNTRFTLNGFMMIRGQQGFYELDNFGQLSLSLNQYFLDKRLQISLFGRDVLRTMKIRVNLDQGDIFLNSDRYSDNQRFGVQLRYQIGIKKREDQQNQMRFDPEE